MEHFRKNGADHLMEYYYHGEKGCVLYYELWQGVYLFQNDFFMEEFPSEITEDYHLMKVNFCLEGRCEVKLRNNQSVYLEPNFLNIDTNQEGAMFYFPGGRYLGLELILDPTDSAGQAMTVFREFGLDLAEEYRELGSIGGTRIGIPSRDCQARLEKIKNLLNQPQASMYGLRLSVLEFLCHMFRYESRTLDTKVTYLTQEQRRIVLQAEKELIALESSEITVQSLAEKYGISATSLENYFKAMFGNSIYQYQKKQRIQKAKKLLEAQPDRKIAEIARECGYQHPGKFSQSFRKETGLSPLQYRRRSAEDKRQ